MASTDANGDVGPLLSHGIDCRDGAAVAAADADVRYSIVLSALPPEKRKRAMKMFNRKEFIELMDFVTDELGDHEFSIAAISFVRDVSKLAAAHERESAVAKAATAPAAPAGDFSKLLEIQVQEKQEKSYPPLKFMNMMAGVYKMVVQADSAKQRNSHIMNLFSKLDDGDFSVSDWLMIIVAFFFPQSEMATLLAAFTHGDCYTEFIRRLNYKVLADCYEQEFYVQRFHRPDTCVYPLCYRGKKGEPTDFSEEVLAKIDAYNAYVFQLTAASAIEGGALGKNLSVKMKFKAPVGGAVWMAVQQTPQGPAVDLQPVADRMNEDHGHLVEAFQQSANNVEMVRTELAKLQKAVQQQNQRQAKMAQQAPLQQAPIPRAPKAAPKPAFASTRQQQPYQQQQQYQQPQAQYAPRRGGRRTGGGDQEEEDASADDGEEGAPACIMIPAAEYAKLMTLASQVTAAKAPASTTAAKAPAQGFP